MDFLPGKGRLVSSMLGCPESYSRVHWIYIYIYIYTHTHTHTSHTHTHIYIFAVGFLENKNMCSKIPKLEIYKSKYGNLKYTVDTEITYDS